MAVAGDWGYLGGLGGNKGAAGGSLRRAGGSAQWMAVESGRLGVAAEGHDNRVEHGLARLLTVDVERALGGIGTVWVTLATPIIVDDGIMPGCSVAGGCFGVEALVHNESAEQVGLARQLPALNIIGWHARTGAALERSWRR